MYTTIHKFVLIKFCKKYFNLNLHYFYFFSIFVLKYYMILSYFIRLYHPAELFICESHTANVRNALLRFLCQSLLWNLSYCPGISSTLSLFERAREPIYLHIYLSSQSVLEWRANRLEDRWHSVVPIAGWCRAVGRMI